MAGDVEKRVIIPLDGMTKEQALELAALLQGAVWGFKVNDLLLECGVAVISELKRFGRVFADAKLHDIPNTVANGAKRLGAAGADLITVHASGGKAMVRAAVEAAPNAGILAVTVLTSLSSEDSVQLFGRDARQAVLDFACSAQESGARGIVCSPHELEALATSQELRNLIRVVPGVRPSWYGRSDDQKRTKTPGEAVASGADLLVIGRPISGHPNPLEAARLVQDEINAVFRRTEAGN